MLSLKNINLFKNVSNYLEDKTTAKPSTTTNTTTNTTTTSYESTTQGKKPLSWSIFNIFDTAKYHAKIFSYTDHM